MWSKELVETIKNIASDTAQSMKPFEHLIGTVTQINPLEIRIDTQKILREKQLLLTDAVRDYTIEVYADIETEDVADHKHKISGAKKIKIKNALKDGETVLILKCEGGQRYIVLGRLEART